MKNTGQIVKKIQDILDKLEFSNAGEITKDKESNLLAVLDRFEDDLDRIDMEDKR